MIKRAPGDPERMDVEQARTPLSIHEVLEQRAAESPEAPAILAPGREPLSYEKLLAHVRNTVELFNGMGIGRGDRVAIVLPNGPEMAVTFLAVAAGATSAPLNPAYRENDFDFYLTDLNAKALILTADVDSPARAAADALGIPIIELTPLVESAAGLFELNGTAGALHAPGGFAQPDDVALVLHTSGTTSRPKIVPLTQTNICTSAHNIARTLQLSPQDCCLNVMPLFHIHGLMGATLSSITAGASIVCTPGFDAAQFFNWMDTLQPTWYSAVPTMHQAVLSMAAQRAESVARSRLRFVRSSSASLPPAVMAELERVFGAPVIEAYGMTEASHQMTSNPLPPEQRKSGSVGVPAGPEVSIMDESGQLLPRGETGEIVIRGANVTLGYENNPEANASAFTDGWFRTGDQGRMDEDGYLYITGRLKEMINRGGEKIAPREIDEVLLNHPNVAQAVAFAVPHPTLGEDVAAAVILRNRATTTEKELRELAFARLADFKVPSQIVIVDEIPKGPTGKLQRIGLAGKLDARLKADYAAPTDQLEMDLTNIWAHTLQLERVGLDDNFFTLGGDSLLAAYLFEQIEGLVDEKLPLALLFRAPTPRQLAEVLRNRTWLADQSSLVPIQPAGTKPPLFCVHPHGGNVLGYRDLAQQLGPDQPFYGLQAQDLTRKQTKPRQFEEMAAHYVKEIRTVQPHGPYYLGGWCLGGNIAYEMAQQLRAQGETVALLVLIQSTHPEYPTFPSGTTALHRLLYSAITRVGLEISNFSEVELNAKTRYMVYRTNRLLTNLWAKVEGGVAPVRNRFNIQAQYSRAYILNALTDSHNQAYEAYEPQPYRGRVALFRAKVQPFGIQPDPTLGWGELLQGELDMQEIPGYRIGMLSEPRVHILAQKLRESLERAEKASAERST